MVYDPDARRETALALRLKAGILEHGPLSVHDYMRSCLHDDEAGYYRNQPAIGRSGDFVTAPEISQVFGELIGLWAAVAWQQMGRPSPFNLVELGPGRGTMLADALRATKRIPGFHAAATVTLVEPNPVLAAEQRTRLSEVPVPIEWIGLSEAPPQRPSIVLANEVLDCLPITQFVMTGNGWREQGVALDEAGRLIFRALDRIPSSSPKAADGTAQPGDVFECRDTGTVGEMLRRVAGQQPLAAVFIDYGHTRSSFGDTLQAVRHHGFEHPLTSPGESDLTSHVDFAAFASSAREWGYAIDGPVTQAAWLGSLGISERASILMAANPSRSAEIETGVMRLMSPTGMGGRFNVLGIRSPNLPGLPGLRSVDNPSDET